jgi:hypothetical protein
MPRFISLPAGLLWPGLTLLYLLLPGHRLALLNGLPLSDFALGAGLLLTLATWCDQRSNRTFHRAAASAAVIACGLKLLLAAPALPYGLTATYSTSADPAAPAERSTEWQRLAPATRVDSTLSLVGDQFPLHFFNDFKRFNYYTAGQPRRDLLPFAVIWQGWLAEPADGQRCLRLEANGTASLRLGSSATARLDRQSHVETRDVCAPVTHGTNPLEVRFSRPQDGVPYLVVSSLTPNGQLSPLPVNHLLRTSAEPGQLELDQWLGRSAYALDLLVTATIAFGVLLALRSLWLGRRYTRTILAGTVLLAFLEALTAFRHFAGHTPILSGGNDWLAYETFARDVGFNGLLMTGGKPLGQGEAFYYQPLYAYFLAALHLTLGESVYGLLIAQYTLVAVAGVLCYLLARELFGQGAAVATLALFWAFRYLIFNQVASTLLSENLVQLIVPAMLLLLVRWTRTWRRVELVGGGVLIGLAILTRTTPLLFLPLALPLVARAHFARFGQRRAALGAAALLLLVALAVFGLSPLRNYLVAGRPLLFPESASTNIYETHRPSAKVDLSTIDHDPLYDRLDLDRRAREVAEFIRQDPLGYAATLVPMGLYPLGITGPALGTHQVQIELLALTALYLAGLVWLPTARSGRAWLVHAFILTHFGQMMVFMSHQYGFRLPLPMYGPMLAIAGASLLVIARFAARALSMASTGPRWLLAGSALALALLWSGRELARPREVEAAVFGLGGDAAAAARAVRAAPASWQADRVYFVGLDQRSTGVTYLPGLAYREMKWFDQSAALVWPAEEQQGLLVLDRGDDPVLLNDCWAPLARQAELSTTAPNDRRLLPIPLAAERTCAISTRRIASFGGLLDLLDLRVASQPVGPGYDLRFGWRVAQRPSFRVSPVLERLDNTGDSAANPAAEVYPAGSWEPGEIIAARLPLPSAAGPDSSGESFAFGFARGGTSPSRLAIDDPLPLYGQTRLSIVR